MQTGSFYDADPARDPFVKSVVEILERCDQLESLKRKLEAREFTMRREYGIQKTKVGEVRVGQ
jgi:hypothetical protein